LDASDMRPASVVRMRGASSRTTIVSPGARSVLFAWVESRDVVRYGVAQW